LPAWALRFGRCGEKLNQISRLFCGLSPSSRGRAYSMGLEFHLLASQLRLIGLNLAQTAANLRRLLCSHAAVFVKVHRLVRHNCLPFSRLFAIPILRSGAPGGLSKNATKLLRSPQVYPYVRSCRRLYSVRAGKIWGAYLYQLVSTRTGFNPRNQWLSSFFFLDVIGVECRGIRTAIIETYHLEIVNGHFTRFGEWQLLHSANGSVM